MAHLDGAQLARLRARDPGALRSVVDDHARRLYRTARGMGYAAAEAEDVVQDVFVTFLETLDRFEGRSQIGTWLFGILHRKSLERRRTKARDDLHDPVDAVFEAQFDARGHWLQAPEAPDTRVGAREAGQAIRSCLEPLGPLQREVFHLRQLEELSAAEVSKICGHSVTHVGVLLHRARLRLRACLEAKGWGRSR